MREDLLMRSPFGPLMLVVSARQKSVSHLDQSSHWGLCGGYTAGGAVVGRGRRCVVGRVGGVGGGCRLGGCVRCVWCSC